jgi:hypothetical protein
MENLYAGIVFGCRYTKGNQYCRKRRITRTSSRTFLCHGFCSPAVAKTRAKPGLIAQAEKSAQVVVMPIFDNEWKSFLLSIDWHIDVMTFMNRNTSINTVN